MQVDGVERIEERRNLLKRCYSSAQALLGWANLPEAVDFELRKW
jgi:hypothetical protein